MSRGINKAILLGYLSADPEIRYSSSGTAVANFQIATSESYKDNDGNRNEKTEWHRIVLFGKTAELAKDYLNKGTRVYLEGKIQTRSWDDQSGQKRYTTEIVGNTFLVLDNGKGKNEQSRPTSEPVYDDSDLPF